MVIYKVLANRLKIIFSAAVEANQCAFITDRLLLENVLLTSKLVTGYHKNTNKEKCVINLISRRLLTQSSGLSSHQFYNNGTAPSVYSVD